MSGEEMTSIISMLLAATDVNEFVQMFQVCPPSSIFLTGLIFFASWLPPNCISHGSMPTYLSYWHALNL